MNTFFQLKNLGVLVLAALLLMLFSCASHRAPSNLNDVCSIFIENPDWYKHAKDVEHRWLVPVPVQMAIIHQESKFEAHAKPPRTRLLGFIPWSRPSTATGYAQALHGTWKEYKRNNGGFFSSRHDFGDGVDFIGWYANQAHRRAGIERSDAYSLYLAYHEGIGGYQRKTYLRKSWLLPVARKVKMRSQLYTTQLDSCRKSLKQRSWFY